MAAGRPVRRLWHQYKQEMIVALTSVLALGRVRCCIANNLHFEGRVHQIRWWIPCDVYEKESHQGWDHIFLTEQLKKELRWGSHGGLGLEKEIKFGFEYGVWYDYRTREMGIWMKRLSNLYFMKDLNKKLSKLQNFVWRDKLCIWLGLQF